MGANDVEPTDLRKVPEWVKAWHDKLTDALYVVDRTAITMAPLDTTHDAQARSEISTHLNKTTIILPYGIAPDKDGYETVAHEVIHASQVDLFAAKDSLLKLIPKRRRKAAFEIWLKAIERWTERTSWGLTRELSPLYAPEASVEGPTSGGGGKPKAHTKEEAKDNGKGLRGHDQGGGGGKIRKAPRGKGPLAG